MKRITYFRTVRVFFFTIKIVFRVRKYFLTSKKPIADDYRKLGEECKDFFLELGGAYIKLGQFLSSLNHALPWEFTEVLQSLQDKVPPHPFAEIEKRFEKEYGKKMKEVFPDISETPIASASTGQVHVASYRNTKVAIKILYPGIESLVKKDLKTISFLLKFLSFAFFPIPHKELHTQFSALLRNELDLLLEFKSLERMRNYFSKETDFVFPKPFREFSRKGILVTSFIEGTKISLTEMEPGNPSRPLELSIKGYLMMLFRYRFFQADPHPGNLLYTPDKKLCFLDFGAVGELTPREASGLKSLMTSVLQRNYYGVIESLDELGLLAPTIDRGKILYLVKNSLERLRSLLKETRYFRNIPWDTLGLDRDLALLKEINLSLKDLFKELNLPGAFLLLQRVFALLVGLSATLDPYRSIFEYAEPIFEEVVLEGNPWKGLWEEEREEILASLFYLPGEVYRFFYKENRIREEIGKQNDSRFFLIPIWFFLTAILYFLFYQNGMVEQAFWVFVFGGFGFFLSLFSLFIQRK